jgi:hypothetical protein
MRRRPDRHRYGPLDKLWYRVIGLAFFAAVS